MGTNANAGSRTQYVYGQASSSPHPGGGTSWSCIGDPPIVCEIWTYLGNGKSIVDLYMWDPSLGKYALHLVAHSEVSSGSNGDDGNYFISPTGQVYEAIGNLTEDPNPNPPNLILN